MNPGNFQHSTRRITEAEKVAMQWNDYMSSKIRKLENQYEHSAENVKVTGLISTIFQNVAIFVNGYTVPPAYELKKLMMDHGGVFHHYYVKNKTTHIIASNLSEATRRCLTTEKVVRPEWITDSIHMNRLLSYESYSLMKCTNPNQMLLPAFAATNTFNDISLTGGFDNYEREKLNVQSVVLPRQDQNYTFSNEQQCSSSSRMAAVTEPLYNANLSATNTNFISDFYSHSRLHLISTMGAEFKEYVNQLQTKSNCLFPGRDRIARKLEEQQMCGYECKRIDDKHLKYDDKKIIMHIDMDCFFVSVGLRNHPHLKGKPVAVAHSKGIGSGTINNAELYKLESSYYHINQPSTSAASFNLDQDCLDAVNEQIRYESFQHQTNDGFISTSEIASCNYEARAAGLRNGMFVGAALKLCPNLQLIPYDFDGYRAVALTLYDTIASYTATIEAISCDELFVDCTEIVENFNCDPLFIASVIREEVAEKTGCTCSAGLGSNLLLARLATKRAKPNGQYYFDAESAEELISLLPVKDLPGVGRAVSSRLNSMGANTCLELQKLSLRILQSEFGPKTGQQLFNFCRGIDDRQIKSQHIRKSVSADVNYGIRFTEQCEVSKFITELAEEVARRLNKLRLKGRNISLKLLDQYVLIKHVEKMEGLVKINRKLEEKVRRKDAPHETAKFMGHGICNSLVRSTSVFTATNDSSVIAKQTEMMLRTLSIVPSDIRGMGIQINHLEQATSENEGENMLLNYIKRGVHYDASTLSKTSVLPSTSCNKIADEKTDCSVPPSCYNLPPLSQLDPTVLDALPDSMRNQIEQEYKNKETINKSNAACVYQKPNVVGPMDFLLQGSSNRESEQIDPDVLQALPKEIQQEICNAYNLENSSSAISTKSALKSSPAKSLRVNSPKRKSPIRKKKKVTKKYLSTITENKPVEPVDAVIVSKENTKKEKAKLGTAEKIDDVKLLLKEWFTSCEAPESDDVTTVSHYVKALVLERNLEKADNVMKYLKRLINTYVKADSSWEECHKEIIEDVQDLVQNIYGAPLKT